MSWEMTFSPRATTQMSFDQRRDKENEVDVGGAGRHGGRDGSSWDALYEKE